MVDTVACMLTQEFGFPKKETSEIEFCSIFFAIGRRLQSLQWWEEQSRRSVLVFSSVFVASDNPEALVPTGRQQKEQFNLISNTIAAGYPAARMFTRYPMCMCGPGDCWQTV